MTSNRSFCNFRLVRENLRRNLWVSVLSAVAFFFALPLPVMITGQSVRGYPSERIYDLRQMRVLIGYENLFVAFIMAVMAVLCGILMYSYLHSRRQIDFYHSLPISRSCMFGTQLVSGILMVLPQYIVMEAAAVALCGFLRLGEAINVAFILKSMLFHFIFFLCIYMISVLCTILTGNTIIACLLDAWALFSVSAVFLLVELCKEIFYRNYGGFPDNLGRSFVGSPVVRYFYDILTSHFIVDNSVLQTAADVPLHIGYLVAAVVIGVLALVLFKRRRSERSGTAIAFEPIKFPLKIYMVAVLSVAFGVFFGTFDGWGWMWFGVIMGVIITHVVTETIYHFDFREALCHKGTMAVMVVLMCALFGMIRADVFGFEKWVPAEDSVESVGVSFWWSDAQYVHDYEFGSYNSMLSDPENIALATELAKECIEGDETPISDRKFERMNVTIKYIMKNGQIRKRFYGGRVISEKRNELSEKLRYSDEFRMANNLLFSFEDESEGTRQTRRGLSFRDSTVLEGDAARATVSDPAQVETLVQAMRKETLELTPEIVQTQAPVVRVDLRQREADSVGNPGDYWTVREYYPIYATFTQTLALLEEYTGMTPERPQVEDVSRVVIRAYPEENEDGSMESIDASIVNAPYQNAVIYEKDRAYQDKGVTDESGGVCVSVTDPLDIAVLLENAVYDGMRMACISELPFDSGRYSFTVDFEDGTSTNIYYIKNQLPNDLLNRIFAHHNA